MPWLIGIDEAGYGPNLGPFVMTSVAARVPDDRSALDLWRTLQAAVRRGDDACDERLLIADSKLVYSPATGLENLETAVLATHQPTARRPVTALEDYIEALCPASQAEIRREVWYDGATVLPAASSSSACAVAAERFARTCAEQAVHFGLIRSVVVCPARFNALLDRWDSKGVVLSLALIELMSATDRAIEDDEPIHFVIDKHGGRNNYAAMLQHAFRDDLVLAYEETRDRSVYRVARARQPVTITVQPRADSADFCVALASMYSKYLRELLMMEFNRFWRRHLPELKPTAGYPTDASRFYAAIEPILKRLAIAEGAMWRRK